MRAPLIRRDYIWTVTAAAAATVVAAALRVHGLGRDGLGHDELRTAKICDLSLGQQLSSYWHDVHPPLFNLLIGGWTQIAGRSEIALRTPSCVAGITAVALLVLLLRPTFGVRHAAAAGLVAALLPGHIYYSQEARSYALAFLTSTLILGAMLAYLRAPSPKRRWLLALACAAGFGTHYVSIFYSAVAVCAAAVLSPLPRAERMRELTRLALACTVTCAPFLPHLVWQRLTNAGHGFPGELSWASATRASRVLAHWHPGLTQVSAVVLAAGIAVALIRRTRADLAVVALAVMPLVLMLVASLTVARQSPLLVPRTMLVYAPPLVVLVGGLVAGFGSRRVAVVTGALGGVAVLAWSVTSLRSLDEFGFYRTTKKDAYREVSAQIAASEEQGPLVLVSLDEHFTIQGGRLDYYFDRSDVTSPLLDASPDASGSEIVALVRERAAAIGATRAAAFAVFRKKLVLREEALRAAFPVDAEYPMPRYPGDPSGRGVVVFDLTTPP